MDMQEEKVIHKELSYKVIGTLFDVFDELGAEYSEKFFEKAVAKGLELKGIKFQRQVPYKVYFKGEVIGTCYFDFLVEGKIILELKKGDYFGRKNIQQIQNYLQVSKLELGIIANFTRKGVKFIRILNSQNYNKNEDT